MASRTSLVDTKGTKDKGQRTRKNRLELAHCHARRTVLYCTGTRSPICTTSQLRDPMTGSRCDANGAQPSAKDRMPCLCLAVRPRGSSGQHRFASAVVQLLLLVLTSVSIGVPGPSALSQLLLVCVLRTGCHYSPTALRKLDSFPAGPPSLCANMPACTSQSPWQLPDRIRILPTQPQSNTANSKPFERMARKRLRSTHSLPGAL